MDISKGPCYEIDPEWTKDEVLVHDVGYEEGHMDGYVVGVEQGKKLARLHPKEWN